MQVGIPDFHALLVNHQPRAASRSGQAWAHALEGARAANWFREALPPIADAPAAAVLAGAAAVQQPVPPASRCEPPTQSGAAASGRAPGVLEPARSTSVTSTPAGSSVAPMVTAGSAQPVADAGAMHRSAPGVEAVRASQDALRAKPAHDPGEPRSGHASPLRVHMENHGGEVAVWLGVDGDPQQVTALVDAVLPDLRKALAAAAQRLGAVTCNGRPLVRSSESTWDKEPS